MSDQFRRKIIWTLQVCKPPNIIGFMHHCKPAACKHHMWVVFVYCVSVFRGELGSHQPTVNDASPPLSLPSQTWRINKPAAGSTCCPASTPRRLPSCLSKRWEARAAPRATIAPITGGHPIVTIQLARCCECGGDQLGETCTGQSQHPQVACKLVCDSQ